MGTIFWVDSPKYCSVEKIEYIKATMDRVEELIMSSDVEDTDTLAKYIDMDSWAKKYIIEEIISELGGKEYIEQLSLLSHEGEVRV